MVPRAVSKSYFPTPLRRAHLLLQQVLAGATLLGCGPDLPSKPRSTVRDSAGITIVENRGDARRAALGWRLVATPAVDIGGKSATGPYRVVEATRLGDGRIVVASAGTNALDLYAPDGRHLRTIGRPGSGPGEFQALFWVGRLPADSIAAWDAALGRLSVFSPAGDFVRAVTSRNSLGLFPLAAGVLGDGRLLIAVRSAEAGAGSGVRVRRDDVSYVALDARGGVQPIGRFPGTEMLLSGGATGGLLMRPLPFGRQTVAAAHGGRVYVGTGDAFELRGYEPRQGLLTIIRTEHAPVAVTRAAIRDYRRTLVTLGAEGDARLRQQQAEMLEKAPYPEQMPAFTDLEIDADGDLWTQDSKARGDGGARWTIFSPDGRLRGSIEIPANVVVREIGRDWLLGTVLDDDQVEHVRIYRLLK